MDIKTKFSVYDHVWMLENKKVSEYMVTDVYTKASAKRGLLLVPTIEKSETYNLQRVGEKKVQIVNIPKSRLFATKEELLKSL